MSAKYQSALQALEVVENCVKAGRDAANASPEEFINALSASSDSANGACIPAEIREKVGRIAVSIFLFVANVREAAQNAARDEIKTAVENAISARVKIELACVGLLLCVVAFVVFCLYDQSACAFGTLLCALYILGFPQLFCVWFGAARVKGSDAEKRTPSKS